MKICSICKIEKDLSKFHKRNMSKDKLSSICKKCKKKYQQNYYKQNREKKLEDNKKYYIKNNKKKLKYFKKYRNNKANYDTYAEQISYADKVKNVDDFLQTKCTYCGKWYFPIIISVQSRINALNGQIGNGGVECHLYCSNECKKECPIYRKRLYSKGHKKSYSREVQPELRQMVFERDDYICIKCRKHQDDLNVPLHCHHIEGIQHNPIESADIDMCMTVCKNCHKEIHKQKGCNYNDMQCKTGDKNEI